MIESGIYIHIPFCKAKCNYCDFNSFAAGREVMEQYVKALLKEIKTCEALKAIKIKTIFMGGGTPTVLPPELMSKIFNELARYSLAQNAEITVEANPGTLSFDYLSLMKNLGINRLSMGLQAWQPKHLKSLGRIHSSEDFIKNFNDAVRVGFNNINIDLMFGIPDQTEADWVETLYKVMELSPKHISAYALIVEEATAFGALHKEGKLITATDELDRKMYYTAREILEQQGLMQYEISNFAKEGFESKHNIIYWTRENYLGFGLSAHSFFNNCRYANTDDLKKYIACSSPVESYTPENAEAMAEFVFLGLRMTKGIDGREFYKRFKKNLFDVYRGQIEKYLKLELLERKENIIFLTKRGMDVSNIIFADFL